MLSVCTKLARYGVPLLSYQQRSYIISKILNHSYLSLKSLKCLNKEKNMENIIINDNNDDDDNDKYVPWQSTAITFISYASTCYQNKSILINNVIPSLLKCIIQVNSQLNQYNNNNNNNVDVNVNVNKSVSEGQCALNILTQLLQYKELFQEENLVITNENNKKKKNSIYVECLSTLFKLVSESMETSSTTTETSSMETSSIHNEEWIMSLLNTISITVKVDEHILNKDKYVLQAISSNNLTINNNNVNSDLNIENNNIDENNNDNNENNNKRMKKEPTTSTFLIIFLQCLLNYEPNPFVMTSCDIIESVFSYFTHEVNILIYILSFFISFLFFITPF